MKIKHLGILLSSTVIFNACSGQPSIPKVSEQEASKYDNKYINEYQNLKKNFKNNSKVKWIQPSNKKEPCKIWTSVNIDNDRTNSSNFKIFWDGDCKNGYASGLGREWEVDDLINRTQIGLYKKGMVSPYCTYKDNLNNISIEGTCNYKTNDNYKVITKIEDDNFKFNINYQYGFISKTKPVLLTYTTPFSDDIIYIKGYPNFVYKITNSMNNEFKQEKYEFAILKNNKVNGFGFSSNKNGTTNSAEVINNNFVRRVQLPQSFFVKADNILSEIKTAGQKAINAQKQALIIKKQYKKRICKQDVKVNFIDNIEYKEICNEDKYYAKLKIKMDNKLSKINQNKTQYRQQQNQKRLIQAREMEAQAAQRQASAAEAANTQKAWDSLNQSIQNMTPKTYNVNVFHY